MENTLNEFGEVLISEIRDKTLMNFEKIITGVLKGETNQTLYKQISVMSLADQETLKRIVYRMVDLTIHNTLFLFEESEDNWVISNPILGIENLSELSDGLSGELYGGNGWIAKYSDFSKEL
ncbi:hypothetical protein ACIXN9_09915 [Bacteroides fragilis]